MNNVTSMNHNAHKLFTADDVRALDKCIIENHGVPGFTLMKRAANYCFEQLIALWPNTKTVIVLCGSGNNGGDGYIVAALAREAGLKVVLFYLSSPDNLSGDAQRAFEYAKSSGVEPKPWKIPDALGLNDTVIVDAMLGTGLNSDVTGDYAQAIEWSNQQTCRRLAVDIPSGLSANTGKALGTTFEACATTTFIGQKIGLYTGAGRAFSGQILYSDLNSPLAAFENIPEKAVRLSLSKLLDAVKPRKANAHKGKFGHTLLIGGNHGFGGAISLASAACARMGCGLTSVATQATSISPILNTQPEVMAKTVTHFNQISPILENSSTVVIGPGLGQDAWAEQMLYASIKANKPTILDADSLNIIAQNPDWLNGKKSPTLLTPHPGEAARLLNTSTSDIEADRLHAVQELSARYQAKVILKGSGSLFQNTHAELYLCPYGNPGMASGGMGDVLSGLLGGLWAQEEWSKDFATCLALCLHAKAADLAVENEGERGLLASDLIPIARALLNRSHDQRFS